MNRKRKMYRGRRPRKRMIPLYMSDAQREGLRKAGRFNAELMDVVREQIRPGIRTAEIDRLVHDYTVDHGHIPACLGYKGFPKSCCTSINEVVCHGIPGDDELKPGDIVNVDLTTIVDGWYGDQSETFAIGEISEVAQRLMQAAFDALWVGIRAAQPGGTVLDIGSAITRLARERGFSVVKQFQGHGIGREFHQEPGIPHYPERGLSRVTLEPGMCFTIEPMLNQGTWEAVVDKSDGWTARTLDGLLSAQFEHTILMTEDGPEPLTLTKNGPQEGHRFWEASSSPVAEGVPGTG